MGKNIAVRRMLKKTKEQVTQDSGYIVVNGKRIDATPVELKARILELIGYPAGLVSKSKDLIYRFTVYTPQEQMKYILFESNETRTEIIRKIFGVDKYQRIRENSSIVVKNLREQRKEIEGKISDIQEKKKIMEVKKSDVKKLEEELKKRISELDGISRKIISEKEKMLEIENVVRKLNNLKKKLEIQEVRTKEKSSGLEREKNEKISLASEMENIGKYIQLMKIDDSDFENFEKEIALIENEIKETELKIRLIRQTVSHLEEEIRNAEKEINEKEKAISKTMEKQAILDIILAEIMNKGYVEEKIRKSRKEIQEIISLEREFENLKKQSEMLKDRIIQLDKCPVCIQDVSMHHKKHVHDNEMKNIIELQGKIAGLVEERKKKEEELSTAEKKLAEILSGEKTAEKLKIEIEFAGKMFAELELKRKKVEEFTKRRISHFQELDKLSEFDVENKKTILAGKKEILKKINERKNLISILEEKKIRCVLAEKMIKGYEDEIRELELEKKKTALEIEKSGNAEAEFEDAKIKFDTLLQEEKTALLKKNSVEKEKEMLNKAADELKKEIEEKEKLAEKMHRISGIEVLFEEQIYSLSQSIERQMMSRIYLEFNGLFQKWFGILTDDAMFNVKLDENFAPVVEQNGYSTEIENLSGGEKTSLALAYRLALNQVINNVMSEIKTKDIIILDEPTDGFSSEQIDKLRDVLEQLNMKQVIIVSHESKIESFVDNVVRIRKIEHESSVETA